ncbi:hypothetical protein BH10PSE9_BH10PSE9_26360 [soil metagenome]
MNRSALLLVIGAIVGGAIGWFTAPKPTVDINVGGVQIQVQGDKGGTSMTAKDNGGGGMQVQVGDRPSLLSDPLWRTVLFAAIGGGLGPVLAGVMGRRTA